jgi:hypothetical protein
VAKLKVYVTASKPSIALDVIRSGGSTRFPWSPGRGCHIYEATIAVKRYRPPKKAPKKRWTAVIKRIRNGKVISSTTIGGEITTAGKDFAFPQPSKRKVRLHYWPPKARKRAKSGRAT